MLNLQESEYFGKNAITHENEIFKLSQYHYEPNFEISEHYHENNYIIVLIKGNYLEKNRKQINVIQTGNILFRPKDYNHCNTFANNGGSCFKIEFKKNWNQNIEFDFRLPTHYENYITGTFASIYKLKSIFP